MTVKLTKSQKDSRRKESLDILHQWLKPGDTVYSVLRHVSTSGMSRRFDFYVIRDNVPRMITGHMSHVLDCRLSSKGGLVVNGCGMDMGFHMVYNLGRTLYPQGFYLSKDQHGRNGDTSGRETDGGYAFRHQWM